ncbi:MAG: hypothetical protein QOE14_1597 [Humisphaera sp.]|nr:hypothetical protein [Humisphaera sp.]
MPKSPRPPTCRAARGLVPTFAAARGDDFRDFDADVPAARAGVRRFDVDDDFFDLDDADDLEDFADFEDFADDFDFDAPARDVEPRAAFDFPVDCEREDEDLPLDLREGMGDSFFDAAPGR